MLNMVSQNLKKRKKKKKKSKKCRFIKLFTH